VIVLPHPSEMMPQLAPCAAHVVGVHPHWFIMLPPPHVFGIVHPPQSIVWPHPSEMPPHVAFCAAHVVGTQMPMPH
jgi:hypothetical protein